MALGLHYWEFVAVGRGDEKIDPAWIHTPYRQNYYGN
jgi:hypothetical protein